MDNYKRISRACDAIKDALEHEKSMRGQPDHELARQDFRNAVNEFEPKPSFFYSHLC